MIEARAFAKVTLSLRVSPRDASGLHPIAGRFQSVDWYDAMALVTAEADSVSTSAGRDVVDGEDNLAWRAVAAVRDIAVTRPPLSLTLDKDIPIAAGVGGGSADAAGALGMAASLLGVDRAELHDLAIDLGSDVPFCLVGGSAHVSGVGERVDPVPFFGGFALGLVVPPVEVMTSTVYRRWDEMGGPSGPPTAVTEVPPALRDEALVNDLYPAAVAVAGEIDEWRTELEHRWRRPVTMAGSGPTLYAFFLDRDEAVGAATDVPVGSRAATVAVPIDHGWVIRPSGGRKITDSKGRVLTDESW